MRDYSWIGAGFIFLFACIGSHAIAQAADEDVRVFRSIEVTGNERFRDGDVLATAGLSTGVPYSENDIVAAVEALEFTGEFRSVRIFSRGDVLTISVVEEPQFSGALTFGAGYSTDVGAFGTIDLKLTDILNGKDLSANLTISKEVQSAGADLSGDTFWPGDRAGGVRADFANFDYDDALFEFQAASLSPYARFGNVENGFGGEVRLTGRWTDISSVDPLASPIIRAEAGERFIAGPGVSLQWKDTVEKRWAAGLNLDVYGGDSEIIDASLAFVVRLPVTGATSWRTSGRIGTVTGFGGGTTTVADRKSLGGSSMRGFARGGLTPVDFCAGCGAGGDDVISDLGGERYAVLQNDLVFDAFSESLPFTPSLYFDIGSAWDVASTAGPAGVLFDDQVWRTSYGIALTAETPLGDFSASYAIETDAEDFDDTERFGLSFVSKF